MARPCKGVTFWDRVYSQVRLNDACLEFTGCRDDCGYGRITKDGKLVRLHRAVWERDNGPIPADKVVMHTCDNRACITPEHLRLGTQVENIQDMDKKGRRVTLIGSQQSQAKLKEADVLEIRKYLAYGASAMSLGRKFGVSDAAIQNIKKGRRWTHVR